MNSLPNIARFSHSKPIYLESIKIICLHVTSGNDVWIKMYKKELKMPLMNRLKCQSLSQHLRTGKMCDDACLGTGRFKQNTRAVQIQVSVLKRYFPTYISPPPSHTSAHQGYTINHPIRGCKIHYVSTILTS